MYKNFWGLIALTSTIALSSSGAYAAELVTDTAANMTWLPAAIVAIYTFGVTIFYCLLLSERKVWSVGRGKNVDEGVIRSVHRHLQLMIPVLPPSNGVVIFGGTGLLIAQAMAMNWDWVSVSILTYYIITTLYIVTFGRIAQLVKYVRTTPSDGPLNDVDAGVRGLISQHRNGLISTLGVAILEFALVII